MAIISENLEFSKEWTDSDDFPTREYSEDKVRDDIQYLFDELKNYINTIVVAAINNHESRIAALGGGGSVGHDVLEDNAIENNNIADKAITPEKFDDDVEEYVGDIVTEGLAQLFDESGDYYDDLTDLIKTTVRNMTWPEWRLTDG